VTRGTVSIRDATASDYRRIVALNDAEVMHTSAMDEARLAALDELSCYHKVACVDLEVSGFLLAMRSGARYENQNFRWFAGKYADFIYVDRIVVSVAAKGLRLGTLLYEDLFRYARDCAIALVTCEYNIVPANEPSRRFHDKFGFKEQGRQWLAGGSKQVSLQVAVLN
jgi:predicted GNAT superfamily acetyltransferase